MKVSTKVRPYHMLMPATLNYLEMKIILFMRVSLVTRIIARGDTIGVEYKDFTKTVWWWGEGTSSSDHW